MNAVQTHPIPGGIQIFNCRTKVSNRERCDATLKVAISILFWSTVQSGKSQKVVIHCPVCKQETGILFQKVQPYKEESDVGWRAKAALGLG
jgi:hypothetical protein